MKVAKAIVAAIGTVTMTLTAVLADNIINADEAGTLVTVLIEAALTIYGVWRIPNRP